MDIDLSFTERTDEIEYSTDECVKDRLATIKNQSEEDYKYVVANILTAKSYFKRIGAYKKQNAAAPEPGKEDTRGGFGAVGIENWVLQNGGSFEKAARDFMAVAEKCESLSEFQNQYAVWDFGENHTSSEKDSYPHDNFVYNMNEAGYKKMKDGLASLIERIDSKEKMAENSREEVDKTSKSKIEIEEVVGPDTSISLDKDYNGAIALMKKKYKKMRDGLASLIERIGSKEKTAENSKEKTDKTSKVKIGIAGIVSQDPSILFDKKYMEAVASVLEKGKKLDKSEIGE